MSNQGTPEKQRRLVDENAAAAYIGRSRKALQKDRLLSTGLPYFKIGASVRYDLNEVETFLTQCARGPRRGTAE